MKVATVIIPYGNHHEEIRFRAMASVDAQTVKCDMICEYSPASPAVVRNKGMNVVTDFLIFLDADDVLHPSFLEECLLNYQSAMYVYTSWMDGNKLCKPAPCPWSADSHHIVTTLYPTALFKYLGGFDEILPGNEDADFYTRSYARGICGVHLDKPLVSRPDGGGRRSILFHQNHDFRAIIQESVRRNGGMARIMAGCCGGGTETVQADPGAGQPGDVLATLNPAGNQTHYSPYTQRIYVGGNGLKMMASLTDIEKWKDVQGRPIFTKVIDHRQLAPTRERVLAESGLV